MDGGRISMSIRALAAWHGCRRGLAALEFAMILPVLLLFTLGALEGGLLLFDYHRLSEATRRGLREALIQPSIIDLADLGASSVACTDSGGVSCGGTTVDSSASFDAIVTAMQQVFPTLGAGNVTVTYADSGLDVSGTGETVTPLITVGITGLSYDFVAVKYLPGLPSEFDFPNFNTTRLAHTTLP